MDFIKKNIKTLFTGGFFHILLGGSLTKVIAFMSSILVVRLVPKEEYGFLAYADNLYAYVLLISGLGCATAILKYCISEDESKNRAYLIFALKFGTSTQIVILLLIAIMMSFIDLAFSEAYGYMYALMFYPFLYFWIGAIQSYMRSIFKNREFAYAGIIQSAIALIGSVGFVLLWGAYGVVVARYLAIIVTIIYCVKVIGTGSLKSNVSLSFNEKKAFISLGVALLISNIFSMIIPYNESFLVNNLIKDATVSAEYKVACLIPAQLPFFTTAIVTYYFPIFAKINDKTMIWKKIKRVGLLTLGIICGVTTVGVIVSPLIITVFYGNQYKSIFGIMTLLWIMNALNAGFRMLPMNILPAVGYAKFNVVVAFITSIVHFVIDYYCISQYGISGAVIAGGIVYILSGFAYWIYLHKKLILE